jgi:hypothetical protein
MGFDCPDSRRGRVILLAAAILLGAAMPSAAQEPAADRERGFPATGPLSGYMDFHFNKPDGQPGVIDFHRFVLLLNHSFSSKVRFVGEVELEHAFVEGLEEAGELELEQAYIDVLLSRRVNLRAGMVLVPMGIINERHEPPVYNGVERPFVDTVIVPSTWFEAGAGLHGELGRGFRYRAYLLAPLNALEFNADEGIRGGRQKGSNANVRNVAWAGRLEYRAVRGLTLGASVWTGESSFEAPRLDTTVRIGEFDARYRRDRLELRAQFAQVGISDAARLDDTIARLTGVSPNMARAMRGFYTEAAYRFWNAGAPRDAVGFIRYENFDTQFRMPDGFVPLKEFDRDAWVIGLTHYIDPDVALKADYVWLRNQSDLIPTRRTLNIGLGWWF